MAMARSDLDMFSLLPEALLLVIVSFLPFKEAARTCVLSRRWLEAWKSTKNIEFNELDFVEVGESDETKEAQRRVFLNFVTNWIAQYKDRVVNKFSLKVSDPENCSDTIQNCIAFATKREVKDLGLDFSDPKWEENDNLDDHKALFDLPEHVYDYGHQTLESLRLYSCGFVMSSLLNFCALKDVSFGWIGISITTLRNLLSACKLIENLSLKSCWNLENFDMGDGRLGLKRLVIDKCNFEFDCLRFNAPCLRYFKYSGEVGASDINLRRHVMEEADIDFGLVTQFYGYGNELSKLLEDLYPVRVLTVCSVLLQAVPCGDEPVRVQCALNVRHLIMKTQMHSHELFGFMFLLNSCPRLDKLTLDMGIRKILPDYEPPYDGVDLTKFWEKVAVPSCLRRTLKVVEMKGLRGTRDELMACFYFLKAGRVLEEINISVLKVEMRQPLARSLLNVPKASRNLKVSIN